MSVVKKYKFRVKIWHSETDIEEKIVIATYAEVNSLVDKKANEINRIK